MWSWRSLSNPSTERRYLCLFLWSSLKCAVKKYRYAEFYSSSSDLMNKFQISYCINWNMLDCFHELTYACFSKKFFITKSKYSDTCIFVSSKITLNFFFFKMNWFLIRKVYERQCLTTVYFFHLTLMRFIMCADLKRRKCSSIEGFDNFYDLDIFYYHNYTILAVNIWKMQWK